jgi:hypothetical protein
MNNMVKALTVVIGITVGAAGCSTDELADGDAPDAIAFGDSAELIDPSDPDRPCEGGAFPGDDEYRGLLCAIQWTELDLFAAGEELDPEWSQRRSQAILAYADDRGRSVAELEALLADMEAALEG